MDDVPQVRLDVAPSVEGSTPTSPRIIRAAPTPRWRRWIENWTRRRSSASVVHTLTIVDSLWKVVAPRIAQEGYQAQPASYTGYPGDAGHISIRRYYDSFEGSSTAVRQRDDIERILNECSGSQEDFRFLEQRIETSSRYGQWVYASRVPKGLLQRCLSVWRNTALERDAEIRLHFVLDDADKEDLRHRYAADYGIRPEAIRFLQAAPIYHSKRQQILVGSTICALLVVGVLLEGFILPTRHGSPVGVIRSVVGWSLAVFGVYRVGRVAGSGAVAKISVATLPAFAGVGYAFAHAIYEAYFQHFGTTPEVAGYDYRVILGQQLAYLLYIAIVGIGTVFGAYGAYSLIFRDRLDGVLRVPGSLLAGLTAALIVVGILAHQVDLASDRGQAVAAGRESTSGDSYFFDFPRTYRAIVTSVSTAVPDAGEGYSSANLIYLGQSGSTIVLYNSSTRSAVLIPQVGSEVAVLDADRAARAASNCRLSSGVILVPHDQEFSLDVVHGIGQKISIDGHAHVLSAVDTQHLYSAVIGPALKGSVVNLRCSNRRVSVIAGQVDRS